MPLWQARALSIDIKPRKDIVLRGADSKPLVVEGVGEVYARDTQAHYWKKIKLVITHDGSWTLISPRDQKRLLLLEKSYPRFLETWRF